MILFDNFYQDSFTLKFKKFSDYSWNYKLGISYPNLSTHWNPMTGS